MILRMLLVLYSIAALTNLNPSKASLTKCLGLQRLCGSGNPVEKLNRHLESESIRNIVRLDDLKIDIKKTKDLVDKLSNEEKDESSQQLVELAKQFIALERINLDNVCQDESIEIVSQLSSSMRQHYPKDKPPYQIGGRVAATIKAMTNIVLENCFDQFDRQWDEATPAGDEELEREVAKNAFEILKFHVAKTCDLPYPPQLSHSNIYASKLIEKTNRDLGHSSNDRKAFRKALIEIVTTSPSIAKHFDIFDAKTGKVKFPDAKSVEKCFEETNVPQACKRLFKHYKVKLAERLIKLVLASGSSLSGSWLRVPINYSKLIKWTANLSFCKRLEITNKEKLFDYVYETTK